MELLFWKNRAETCINYHEICFWWWFPLNVLFCVCVILEMGKWQRNWHCDHQRSRWESLLCRWRHQRWAVWLQKFNRRGLRKTRALLISLVCVSSVLLPATQKSISVCRFRQMYHLSKSFRHPRRIKEAWHTALIYKLLYKCSFCIHKLFLLLST